MLLYEPRNEFYKLDNLADIMIIHVTVFDVTGWSCLSKSLDKPVDVKKLKFRLPKSETHM